MRIIFVGIHNKPGLSPLDPSTKTGKVITRIIDLLPSNIEKLRTNLFDSDSIPKQNTGFEVGKWVAQHWPNHDDIILVLGNEAWKYFPVCKGRVFKVKHPGRIMGGVATDDYVQETATLILNHL